MLPLFLKIKDRGALEIRVDFSGSGDSGDIDDIEIYGDGDGDYATISERDEIRDAMYDFIDECIDNMDWYNNDGGYGNITINLETFLVDTEYYERTVNEYSWEGTELFDV